MTKEWVLIHQLQLRIKLGIDVVEAFKAQYRLIIVFLTALSIQNEQFFILYFPIIDFNTLMLLNYFYT
jgi:hypothetical protein